MHIDDLLEQPERKPFPAVKKKEEEDFRVLSSGDHERTPFK